MAITGEIEWDAGPVTAIWGGGGSTTVKYILRSDNVTDHRADAAQWMLDNAPNSLYGFIVDSATVSELVAENLAADPKEIIWRGEVKYKSPELQKPNKIQPKEDPEAEKQEVRMTIRSGTGEMLNMKHSRKMVAERHDDLEYGWGGYAGEKLLNVSIDNNEDSGSTFVAEGIQVPSGTIEIIAETLVSPSKANAGFVAAAVGYAAKNVINEKDWRGFPAQSLKLTSVDWQQRQGLNADSGSNTEFWDVTYAFSYSAPLTAAELNANKPPGLDVANTPPDWTVGKTGWQYLDTIWVDDYKPGPTGAFEFSIPVCKRQSIHDIYEAIDFAEVLKI